MWLIRGVLGHRKGFVKKGTEFIFQFSLKIEIVIWNSFFDLIMETKNGKNAKFYFILKQKSNAPLDPRILMF